MQERSEIALEVAGASIANKATLAGAATGAVGWLSQINWLGLAGLLVAVIGLAFNVYFQRRRDQREAAESEARIAAITGAFRDPA